MAANPYLIFQEATPTRAEVVATARRFLRLEYSLRQTLVREDSEGVLHGKVDCLGLLFEVAKRLGYLPGDFNPNQRRPKDFKLSPDEAMLQVLHTNLMEIGKEAALPGDIFLMKYLDIDPASPYHVAIKTDRPWLPYGSILHAVNQSTNAQRGAVYEIRIDGLEWNRILSAWRLPGIKD